MVRPGLKRLMESQRVKVQPNKTGTSKMLGMPFNKMNGMFIIKLLIIDIIM